MEKLRTYNWGILGCGRISNDFILALNSPDRRFSHIAHAVATSNDLSRAQDFAKTHGVLKAYGSYKELCQDPKIDIIYIGTTNNSHFENAKLALVNKKHVLVEKPIALNVNDIKKLYQIAKENDCFLMEGMWSRCIPLIQKLGELINNNRIGAILSVCATFPSSSYYRVERISKKELGGGGLYDAGIYPIQFGLFCYDDQPPDDIIVTGVKDAENIDTVSNINLIWHKKGIANCFNSTIQAGERSAIIIGTKASIRFNYTFWTPTEFEILEQNDENQQWEVVETIKGKLPGLANEEKIEMENKPGYGFYSDKLNFVNSGNLLYEADHVVDMVRRGRKESTYWSEEKCLNTHRIIEYALGKINNA